MTIDNINSVLCEITSTQMEAYNLIDHIHRAKDIGTKRPLLPFGGLFHFLFGTANDEDVRSMKQDVRNYTTPKLGNPKFKMMSIPLPTFQEVLLMKIS